MLILLCIDDTDNLDSRGTGELATIIANTIEDNSWGKCSGITRHQLFIHPDIPYTSHNSSMCFEAEINETFLENIICYSSDFLKNESAEGSDPGLCVAALHRMAAPDLLIDFGKRAKKEVVTKEDAYNLADELGVYLSEHGGTGQGVIGALAGVGLRLTGNDGRFKGKIMLDSESGIETVDYILSKTNIDRIITLEGNVLKDNEFVIVSRPLKSVFLDGKSTLLVNLKETLESGGGQLWEPCKKEQLSVY